MVRGMRFLVLSLLAVTLALAQTTPANLDEALFRKFFERLRLPVVGDQVERLRISLGLTPGEMDAVVSSVRMADGELHPYSAAPGYPAEQEQRRILEAYLDRIQIDLGPARFQVLRAAVRKAEAP